MPPATMARPVRTIATGAEATTAAAIARPKYHNADADGYICGVVLDVATAAGTVGLWPRTQNSPKGSVFTIGSSAAYHKVVRSRHEGINAYELPSAGIVVAVDQVVEAGLGVFIRSSKLKSAC